VAEAVLHPLESAEAKAARVARRLQGEPVDVEAYLCGLPTIRVGVGLHWIVCRVVTTLPSDGSRVMEVAFALAPLTHATYTSPTKESLDPKGPPI